MCGDCEISDEIKNAEARSLYNFFGGFENRYASQDQVLGLKLH